MHPARKAEIDRLAGLAHLGAEQAALAFAQVVGRTISTEAPIVREGLELESATRAAARRSDWSTGVFFEFEGCLEAVVGILFEAAASEALVRRIVGIESGEIEPAVIESALMEVGNILASHVASGIADRLKSRLLPSIPSLAMDDAESALRSLIADIAGSDALQIESVFKDDLGELGGRLILVPTQVAHWAPIDPASETPEL